MERLEGVAVQCRGLGAEVWIGRIDVRARAELMSWLEEFDRAAPIDLLIANAGVIEGTRPGGTIEPPDAAYALIETNVLGVLNTVQPLIPRMTARGRGQIAIVGSIAGFIPLPDAPSYCASKSAVLNYGRALRDVLAPHGVGVSVIASAVSGKTGDPHSCSPWCEKACPTPPAMPKRHGWRCSSMSTTTSPSP